MNISAALIDMDTQNQSQQAHAQPNRPAPAYDPSHGGHYGMQVMFVKSTRVFFVFLSFLGCFSFTNNGSNTGACVAVGSVFAIQT